jgi:hypothetical protein
VIFLSGRLCLSAEYALLLGSGLHNFRPAPALSQAFWPSLVRCSSAKARQAEQFRGTWPHNSGLHRDRLQDALCPCGREPHPSPVEAGLADDDGEPDGPGLGTWPCVRSGERCPVVARRSARTPVPRSPKSATNPSIRVRNRFALLVRPSNVSAAYRRCFVLLWGTASFGSASMVHSLLACTKLTTFAQIS